MQTHYDISNGWLRFGGENNSLKSSYVEFFPGTIMGIDDDGNITELWLHPILK
ncbi:hypothetical protein [Lactiplantibacillus pentosus]|uniref:hypothetical protein n=1 Tax=Lactiplantibacillus pentosus TaxID=1589 RepID=UPI001ADD8C4F|nr:hypothetical protein [Lactiplantibacillus pentosus]